MKRKRMEIYEALLEAAPRDLEDEALADIMDALSWHPHAAFNLKDAAALLTLAGNANPMLGERIRRLAQDALDLAGRDEVSAGRAALVGHVLQQLLEGKSPDELEEVSAGWQVANLACLWIERGIEDPRRLEAVIAELIEESN